MIVNGKKVSSKSGNSLPMIFKTDFFNQYTQCSKMLCDSALYKYKIDIDIDFPDKTKNRNSAREVTKLHGASVTYSTLTNYHVIPMTRLPLHI